MSKGAPNKSGAQLPVALFDSLNNLLINQNTTPSHVLYPQDYAFAKTFLLSYRGSEATFNAYRREIERLMQWSWLILKQSILKITRADFEKYLEWLFCSRGMRSLIFNDFI